VKKILCFILITAVLTAAGAACLAEDEMAFAFSLTCDGKTELTAAAGDVLTFTFTLRRTDADRDYDMYAMQNEILFDSACLAFVEGSQLVRENVSFSLRQLRDGRTAIYMNTLSLSGAERWSPVQTVGTFQLEVIGQSGVSNVCCENCQVSTPAGDRSYPVQAENTALILSTDCTVTFVTNGGTAVPPQTVPYGRYAACPQAPERAGYTLEGWYSDLDTQNRWDFETMPVRGNMTLYAAWTQGEPVTESGQTGSFPHASWLAAGALVLLILLGYFLITRKKGER